MQHGNPWALSNSGLQRYGSQPCCSAIKTTVNSKPWAALPAHYSPRSSGFWYLGKFLLSHFEYSPTLPPKWIRELFSSPFISVQPWPCSWGGLEPQKLGLLWGFLFYPLPAGHSVFFYCCPCGWAQKTFACWKDIHGSPNLDNRAYSGDAENSIGEGLRVWALILTVS